MPLSPDSSRARLVREMSRDLNKSGRSDSRAVLSDHGSIPDTTVSDFDPDNEALMSTRQLDNTTNQLPELRASARKFARRNNTDVDFVMDTSAIGRAFPDFTMGGSSDDGSDSIELGRGGKKAARGPYGHGVSREFSSHAPYSVGDESMRSSKAMIGSFEVLSTPPARPKASLGGSKQVSQSKRSVSSQKENQDPSPPPAKTSDYVSNGSKSSSSRERRTLAEIHARVTSEDDGSLLSEERPPTVNLTAKSSRFVSTRNRQSPGAAGAGVSVPSKFTTTEDFLQDLAHGTGASQSSRNAQGKAAASGTAQQSFLLPDLPNLSELVSGVFNDGTPVFSRSGGPRSRFVSSTYPRSSSTNKPDHIPIESIPVPEEERALFVSLKLLQDKLAEVENEKSEAKKRIEELKGENEALKAERKERERLRRSDSALGMADSGSDGPGGYGGRNGNWVSEKLSKLQLRLMKGLRTNYVLELESTVKSLQTRLDAANRKVSVSEITIKNLTQDRDSAVSQLGVAFYTSEGLKVENEALRAENETLKSRLAQIETERENETKNWIRKEASLKKKVERREEAVREVREMTREIWELRQDGETQVGAGKGKGNGVKRQTRVSDSDHRKAGTQTLDTHERKMGSDVRKSSYTGGKTASINPATGDRRVPEASVAVPVEATRARSRSRSRHRPSATATDNKEAQKKKRTRQIVVEETVDTSSSDEELDQEPSRDITTANGREEETNESLYELSPRVNKENARDMTDLSFLQVGDTFKLRHGQNNNIFQDAELARMRKTLEEERVAHRRRTEAAAAEAAAKQEKTGSVRVEKPVSQPVLPRKSSMKDLTTNTRTARMQSEDEHTGRFSVKVRATFDQVSGDEVKRVFFL
jgi:Centrosome localisation domain of PPC89